MRRRGKVGIAVAAIWLVGLALLARRELMRGAPERLTQAALLVAPDAQYYTVVQRGRQIGFASSTVDTTSSEVSINDLFVADVAADSAVHRASARLIVRMTRALRLKSFQFELGPEMGALKASGTVLNDSTLSLIVAPLNSRADTQRVAIQPPLLLPTAVPLALALGEKPKVGHRYTFSVFDPMAMRPGPITLKILAESTFVVSDSAVFDTLRATWVAVHYDTLKAWHIEPDSGSSSAGLLSGWVDERGRMVQATEFNSFALRRAAYEIVFKNWQSARRTNAARAVADDIQEATAIEASAPIANMHDVSLLRVRLRNADLTGFTLDGTRQTLHHDTLEVRVESPSDLIAHYPLPDTVAAHRMYLAPEPLIQSDDPQIREVSMRVRSARDAGKRWRRVDRDPQAVAREINDWVHRNLEKKVSLTVPNAIEVLHKLRGDCNEHTVLYIALARAAGLPARSAAGLVYVGGKFYYHAWPEVFLGTWVPVDPTFGQFPADASHLRFVTGGYVRQAELLKLVGNLQIDVLSAETESANPSSTPADARAATPHSK